MVNVRGGAAEFILLGEPTWAVIFLVVFSPELLNPNSCISVLYINLLSEGNTGNGRLYDDTLSLLR